jgi:hypothetical protein
MTTVTRHAVTAIFAVLASLGAQAQLHIGDPSIPAQRPAASPAQLSTLRGQLRVDVASLQAQLADTRQANVTALRNEARFMRQAAALAEHVAGLEASTDPSASTIDFQRSIGWKVMADQIDPGD